MSLSVDVFLADARAPGGTRILGVPSGHSDLAGPESWRTQVWGSSHVRDLGARLLPRLVAEDLWVEPGQVPVFQAECELIRTRADEVAAAVGVPEEKLRARAANLCDAAERALGSGGGVVVW